MHGKSSRLPFSLTRPLDMDFFLRAWREADSPPLARARSSASSISGSRFIHSLTLCDSGTPSWAAA